MAELEAPNKLCHAADFTDCGKHSGVKQRRCFNDDRTAVAKRQPPHFGALLTLGRRRICTTLQPFLLPAKALRASLTPKPRRSCYNDTVERNQSGCTSFSTEASQSLMRLLWRRNTCRPRTGLY